MKIPIIDAARRGNLALLQECLEAGMSVNSLDKSGSSSLHAAAQGGHIECILRLLKEPKLEINWQVIHLLWFAFHCLSETNCLDELLSYSDSGLGDFICLPFILSEVPVKDILAFIL